MTSGAVALRLSAAHLSELLRFRRPWLGWVLLPAKRPGTNPHHSCGALFFLEPVSDTDLGRFENGLPGPEGLLESGIAT